MNNIYIGNRYVPIFADPIEWNNTREYEPLTIVLHNGTSYTSKKTVPLGVNISNKEYWALTGNYNAQVEIYRQETAQVAEDLTAETAARTAADNALAGDIEAEETARAAAVAAEATARAAAVTAETNARTAEDYLLNGGDLLCIGDSYLKGSNHTGTPITSWGDYLAAMLGKTAGSSYFKYAQGACGFVQTSEGINFQSLLDRARNEITDRNKVGTIVVLGGVNDGTNDTKSAINTFLASAVNYFPNAKVYYTFGSTFIDSPQSFILTGNECYESAFGQRGVYVGSIARYMSAYKYYDSDNQHPNADGQKLIAKLLYAAVKGAAVPQVNRKLKRIGQTDYYYNYISNDVLHLGSYGKLDLTLDVDNYIANGSAPAYTKELTAADCYFNKTSNEYYHTTTGCILRFLTGDPAVYQYYTGSVDIKLTGQTLEFTPYSLNSDYGNYGNGKLVRMIVLPFEFKVPVNLI